MFGDLPEGMSEIGPIESIVNTDESNYPASQPQLADGKIKTQIRWLIRRDMPEVLGIENDSFEYAWKEEDFLCCLRQRNCIGLVSESYNNNNNNNNNESFSTLRS